MIYMKHHVLGNLYFDDKQQVEQEALGWVRWPRTIAQKNASLQNVEENESSPIVEEIKRKRGRPPVKR
jgi:hypothetical protein